MKKQYKIQLPKGKTLTNITKISFKDDFLVIDAEIENEERFVRIATEKVGKAAKKLIKEYDEQTDQILKMADYEYVLTVDNENICAKEQQKYEPKDEEFIHLKWEGIKTMHPYEKEEREAIAIFKEIKDDMLFCYITHPIGEYFKNRPTFIPLFDNNGHKLSNGYTSTFDEIRPATEKEKKLLIDQLAKVNKKWNQKMKRIEDVRWRAKEGEEYYYFTINKDAMDGVWKKDDMRALEDDNRYVSGNYFKTYEAAEKVVEQIQEIFKNSKAE